MEVRTKTGLTGASAHPRTSDMENGDSVQPHPGTFSGIIEVLEKGKRPSKKSLEDAPKGYIREMSWPRRIIAILWLILIYGCNAAILRYSIISFLEIRNSSSFMSEIIQNWQQGAITDITVAASCPTGYEIPYSASFGTKPACDCRSVDAATLESNSIDCFICVGKCNAIQTSAGCTDYASLGPFSLSYFAVNEGDYSSLCVKRSTYTYDKLAPLTSASGECPSGYKLCSSNSKSLYNFCISDEEECPINKVTFQDVSGNPSYTCNAPDCFVVFKNTSTSSAVKVMEISRTTADATPISDIGINQYSMCLSKSSLNLDANRANNHPFVLDSNTRTVCNTEQSASVGWTDFISLKESELMTINGIYDKIKGVPGYGVEPGILDPNWVLSYRSYIPFLSSCREFIDRYTENGEFVVGLKDIQTISMYVNIGSAVLSIIVLCSYQMALLFGWAHFTIFLGCLCKHSQSKVERRYKITEGINFVIYILCQGGQLFLTVWEYLFSSDQTAFYQTLCNNGCTISPWIETICEFSDEFSRVFQYNFIIMIVLSSMIFVEIVIIILECCLAARAKSRKLRVVLPISEGINSLMDVEKKPDGEAGTDDIMDSTRNLMQLGKINTIEKQGAFSPTNAYGSPRSLHNDASTQITHKIYTGNNSPRVSKIAHKFADVISQRPISQERSSDEGNSVHSHAENFTIATTGQQLVFTPRRIPRETHHKLFLNNPISRAVAEQIEGNRQTEAPSLLKRNSGSLSPGRNPDGTPRSGWYTPRSNTRGNVRVELSQPTLKENNTTDFLSRFRPQNTNTPPQSNAESPSSSTSNFFKKFMHTETQQPQTFSSFYNHAVSRTQTIRPKPFTTFKTLKDPA